MIKHSPGVAKRVCRVAAGGNLNSGSYNTASSTKNSTGNYTITIDTDSSGTLYSVQTTLKQNSDFIGVNFNYNVGTFAVETYDGGTLADGESINTMHGDL